MVRIQFQFQLHRLLLDSIQSTNGSKASSGGDGGGGSGSNYTGDGNFDSNMVIILAALLCALICALGLNSIVRCAIRCSNRFVFETPHQASVRLASTGLKKHVLNEIPVVVYSSGLDIVSATECPICLGDFADGEKVRILPKCNHGFHVKCIDTWLVSRSSCPICRRPLCEVSPVKEEAAVLARANGTSEAEQPTSSVVVTVHEGLFARSPQLTRLRPAECSKISDDGLIATVLKLPLLTEIAGTPQIYMSG